MIDAKQTLTGTINASQSLTGELNKTTEYIQPILQEKEVMPTKEKQKIICDTEYDGLSKVTVNKIPDEYVIPRLSTKTITKNGVYKAIDDGVDGYSEVNIETASTDINDYFSTTITDKNRYYFGRNNMIKAMPSFKVETKNLSYLFSDAGISIAPTLIGEEKVTNFYYFLQGTNIKEIPQYNTKNGTNFQYAFYTDKLEKMPLLNFESANNIYNVVSLSSSTLIDVGGFQNLGKNYSKNLSENSANTRLNLSAHKKLTHESLMNVINNLYDIASAGVKPQQLVLGSENLAKLTAEEIAVGTVKGWNIN